jgi:uncharacterized protein (DUF433 family)
LADTGCSLIDDRRKLCSGLRRDENYRQLNVLYRLKAAYIHVGRPVMSEIHRIILDPNQCGGRPCLRGLRIRVRDVLAAGASCEEILADYPLLEAGDITASLEYAARQSDHPVLRVA